MHTCLTNGNAFDRPTYEAPIQRFQLPIFNLVSRLVDDPSDAVDATVAVFHRVFEIAGTFRDETALNTFIYRIAVKEARHRRRWFARPRLENPHPIERALSTMNPKARAALVLREIEGLSYEEIAEILDVPIRTAKSRIARGQDELRDRLATHLNPASTPDRLAQAVD
ncbi:MAG: sigma factor-like helix-turn-helix DNA-binding protein [Bryobacteraceae bacterium]|jgi:RNA polymerase sigma-70 factor (ECF subfamily)